MKWSRKSCRKFCIDRSLLQLQRQQWKWNFPKTVIDVNKKCGILKFFYFIEKLCLTKIARKFLKWKNWKRKIAQFDNSNALNAENIWKQLNIENDKEFSLTCTSIIGQSDLVSRNANHLHDNKIRVPPRFWMCVRALKI